MKLHIPSSFLQYRLDLMLLIVERGIQFAREGDLPEAYFDGIYHMFERACKLIVKKGLQVKFKQKCADAIRNCDIDYGLCEMFNVYDQYFP